MLTVGEDFVVSLNAFLLRVISPRRAFAAVSEAVANNIATNSNERFAWPYAQYCITL